MALEQIEELDLRIGNPLPSYKALFQKRENGREFDSYGDPSLSDGEPTD